MPLWPLHGVNLGTLLRTCDAVGACLAVPRFPWVPEALRRGRTIAVLGHEQSGIPPEALDLLDVAVAGGLVLHELAGLG